MDEQVEAGLKVDKEKGVCLNLIFGRHGEKAPDGGLLESDSRPWQIGREIGPDSKAYASFAPRAVQTAEKIAEGVGTLYKTRERFELITSKLLPKKFSDDLRKDHDLGFGAILADEGASALVASGLAALIERFRRMSTRLKGGTNLNLPCITHDLEIACFLKQALVRNFQGRKILGFENIEEIGGPFATNEYFQLTLKRAKDKEKISLKFSNPQRLPGVSCEIDMNKVKQLAFLYREKTKEEN